nr:MAG TPA: hypothetical protein [Caudoviricetes sp.]
MSKVVNITDKLNFEENPALQIGDMTVEVHADAETVLRLMGTLKGKDDVDINAVTEMMKLLFDPEAAQQLCAMERDGKKLSARSLMVIVQEGMNLVIGDDSPGEQ